MKFTLFTDHPHGTLGNLGAAKKLIVELKARDPLLEIMWVILDVDGKLAVPDLIPAGIDSHIVKSWDETLTDRKKKRAIYHDRDLFITFPQAVKDGPIKEYIKSLNLPYVVCQEYDTYNRQKLTSEIELSSGLGKDKIGIFISPPLQQPYQLSHIATVGGQDLVTELFGKDVSPLNKEQLHHAEDAYLANHNLFMGYFNNPSKFGRDFVSNPIFFCYMCILKSVKQDPNKKIDLIVRLDQSEYDDLRELITKAATSNPLLKKVHLQDYNSPNETVPDPAKISVRIQNKFPYPQEIFNSLVRASNRFCGLTGDQSFSTGLGEEKIIMYERMTWKRHFFDCFLAYIKENLGENSPLYQFYEKQKLNHFEIDATKIKRVDFMLDLLLNQEKTLIEQAKIIREMIEKEKNLTTILPATLMDIVKPQYLVEKAKNGDLQGVQQLLNEGANINFADKNGTALIVAAKQGHIEIVQELLAHNAAIEITDQKSQWTALQHAIYHGHEKCALKILAITPKLAPSDDYSQLLVTLALNKGMSKVLSKLIKKGVDINSIRESGDSLLIWAVKKEYADFVELLVKNDANIHQKNGFGKSAFDYAAQSRLESIKKILKLANDRVKENMPETRSKPILQEYKQDNKSTVEIAQDQSLSNVNLEVKNKRKLDG